MKTFILASLLTVTAVSGAVMADLDWSIFRIGIPRVVIRRRVPPPLRPHAIRDTAGRRSSCILRALAAAPLRTQRLGRPLGNRTELLSKGPVTSCAK